MTLFPIGEAIKYNYINNFLENYFCWQVTITITRIIPLRIIYVMISWTMVPENPLRAPKRIPQKLISERERFRGEPLFLLRAGGALTGPQNNFAEKSLGKSPKLRGRPSNDPFISRDTCSDSIARSFVLVFVGYRTIIARYVAKWGIARMCLCETKYQGGVSHHFGGVLTSLKKYRAIWGIAAIVSQYRAIWGH